MRRCLFVLLFVVVHCVLPAYALQVVTGSYVGNATDNTDITISPACQPVAVFVKRDTAATDMIARFSSMSTNESKVVTGSTAVATTQVKALLSNGFRLGSGSTANGSGATHYYTALCDNGQQDIAVTSWTGDGTDNKNISIGASFTPELVVLLRSDSGVQYWRGSTSHSGDSAAELNALDSNSPNAIQSVSAGIVQVGTSANTNTVVFYLLALKGSSGVQTNLFTGNATDNRNITAMNNPKFVLLKGDSLTNKPAYKFGIAGDAAWCGANASAADIIQAFQTGGYQIGTNSCANENTIGMPWFALTDFSASSTSLRRRFQ